MNEMNTLSQSVFRDADDLDQATRFLHENGKPERTWCNCLCHVFDYKE